MKKVQKEVLEKIGRDRGLPCHHRALASGLRGLGLSAAQINHRTMTMNLAIIEQHPLSMSSREVSELLDVRHDNVKRTVERLVERGTIVQPPMEDEQKLDAMGRARTTSIYHLAKRDSYVVVAQLSPEFTACLVDRWQELESAAPAHPDLSNPAIAARAWADQFERSEAQAAQIEAMRDDVAAYERLAGAED